MSEIEIKPLFWEPDPSIGYSVERRPDGGMQITFTDTKQETLQHWYKFALKHLIESDRLTRNLYDLRQIEFISEESIRFAIEANSDPSARNIRLAVVVANDDVADGIRAIAALTEATGGAEIKLFTEMDKAESWLARPLGMI